jgi:two-component system NtrC family sensor kinase
MKGSHLSVRLVTGVGGASLVVIGVFAWISIVTLRQQNVANVMRNASQFSDTVMRSTHHAMLQNRWQDAFYIMETIGQQPGVSRVRIFSKEGLILFSTDKSEQGTAVDKRAESCYACHAAEKPLERLMIPERSRIIKTAQGGRILGMIAPIENEPSCSQAACHAHPPDKRILGVLDVGLSLAQADAYTAAMGRRMGLFAAVLVLLIVGVLFLLLRRSVLRPVRNLVEGTERVARGDLDYVIEAPNGDEIGLLARSFNAMTSSLRHTQAELASLVENLEERVAERTNALRDAQTQLIQSSKMASLGRLSASIAHEINNPLSGILTYAKLVSRKFADGRRDEETIASAVSSLALVERETERCITIVRNLLDFSRQRDPSFEQVEPNAVIGEALSLLQNRIALDGITLEQSLAEVPRIRADFGQLRQALLNTMLNAFQAMEKGGVLRVSSRFIPEEQVVEIEIGDTGVGIPPGHLSSIFDPFFTTKDKGTGLGLSVVYGIIDRHGGHIDIQSEMGKGTSVVIRLPVSGATS